MTSKLHSFGLNFPTNLVVNSDGSDHQVNEIIVTANDSRWLESTSIAKNIACTNQPIPTLIDKVANVALQNREVGLIIAAAAGVAIVVYATGKSVAELIRACRDSHQD